MNTISIYKENYCKELLTTTLGITIGASANIARQYLLEYAAWPPVVARNFVSNICIATSMAGMVAGIYSAICLSKKISSDENNLQKAVTATALGAIFYSAAYTAYEHFFEIAPSFYWLEPGESIAYCIGTNFAWQISCAAGIAAMAFTGYAAYRVAKSILAANSH